VLANLARTHDVQDSPAADNELVGDQAAVAAPRQGFGTHDCSARFGGHRCELLKSAGEVRGQHVIRKCSEGGDTPSGILGGWNTLCAPTAQVWKVDVLDFRVIKGSRERLAAKLRISSRSRETTYVGDGFDPFFSEQR
jgi:hypothetical protein